MNALTPVSTVSVRAVRLEDEAAIEAFLAAHPEATPFHRPVWTRAIEAGCGQKAHSLLAERAGAITGYLPLTHVRSRLFGSALVSAGFAVDGGILALDEESAVRLAEAAVALADALGCPTVELRGGEAPEGWQRREGVYADFARPLAADEEAILLAIPKRQRAEVRRGMGQDLVIECGRDAATQHRIYSESVRNLGTPVFPKSLFEAVLDGFGDDAEVMIARKDGRPISTVLTLYFKGGAYPYWGGGTREARQLRANEYLYYRLMCRAAERGCTRFDFGRSKVGTGPYAFKKNWGFEPRPLVYAVHGEGRDTNPLSAQYQLKIALWKKLPLAVANLLGPPIARGLG